MSPEYVFPRSASTVSATAPEFVDFVLVIDSFSPETLSYISGPSFPSPNTISSAAKIPNTALPSFLMPEKTGLSTSCPAITTFSQPENSSPSLYISILPFTGLLGIATVL